MLVRINFIPKTSSLGLGTNQQHHRNFLDFNQLVGAVSSNNNNQPIIICAMRFDDCVHISSYIIFQGPLFSSRKINFFTASKFQTSCYNMFTISFSARYLLAPF